MLQFHLEESFPRYGASIPTRRRPQNFCSIKRKSIAGVYAVYSTPLAATFLNLDCKFSLPLVFTQHSFPITQFYDDLLKNMFKTSLCDKHFWKTEASHFLYWPTDWKHYGNPHFPLSPFSVSPHLPHPSSVPPHVPPPHLSHSPAGVQQFFSSLTELIF